MSRRCKPRQWSGPALQPTPHPQDGSPDPSPRNHPERQAPPPRGIPRLPSRTLQEESQFHHPPCTAAPRPPTASLPTACANRTCHDPCYHPGASSTPTPHTRNHPAAAYHRRRPRSGVGTTYPAAQFIEPTLANPAAACHNVTERLWFPEQAAEQFRRMPPPAVPPRHGPVNCPSATCPLRSFPGNLNHPRSSGVHLQQSAGAPLEPVPTRRSSRRQERREKQKKQSRDVAQLG